MKFLSVFMGETRKKDVIFSVAVAMLCVILTYTPTGFEDRVHDGTQMVKGKIIGVDDSSVTQIGIVKTGSQFAEAEIMEGELKGKVIRVHNPLMGKMELDKIFEDGDYALINLTVEGGVLTWAKAVDHYRLGVEFWLMCLFAVFLVIFAGFTGVQAILSFAFSALCLWKILIPMMLKGFDPVIAAFIIVMALSGVILFLVAGLNLKGLVAFLGATLGLGATCAIAIAFADPFRVNGAVRAFSETLVFSGFYNISLKKIFLAGVFLSSSGAVMDLAMDISSALNEIVRHNPVIERKELLLSGFRVGRAVIGSMTTTLILAYSGSYLTMLMLFMGQGIPTMNILNINYVSAEIFHTLVGSFGLVLVAPITAIIGTILYVPKKSRS